MMSESVRILYKDSKFFWRERCTVDIVIVEHHTIDTLEVICHEGTTNQSADRMYFRRSILVAKFDSNELDDKLRLAKEAILRRHESPDEKILQGKILDTAITEYILCRLYVTNFSSASFDMEFRLESLDDEASLYLPLCEKPAHLAEYNPNLFHPLKAGEMEHALKDLETEQSELKKECDEAALLETKVRRHPQDNDRLRVPYEIAINSYDKNVHVASLEFSETTSLSTEITTNDLAVAGTATEAAQILERVPEGETDLQNVLGRKPSSQGKSNRWKDSSPSNRTTPKNRRKNSFSMGIAALQSSLQRTLGLLSSKKHPFDSTANADTTTEHMLAAVGSDLESEAPSVVMVRRTPTAADGVRTLRSSESEASTAQSLTVTVAKNHDSLRRGETHSFSLSTLSTSPLNRTPSHSHAHSQSQGAIAALTPSSARRSSSRWTGERSRHNKAPSQQELQQLELADDTASCTSVSVAASTTTTTSASAGAGSNLLCNSFDESSSLEAGAESSIRRVRLKPVPLPVAHQGQCAVVVSDCVAHGAKKITEKADTNL